MLIPTGLKGNERKQYVEENNRNIRGPKKSRVRRQDYPGLRPVGVKAKVEKVVVKDDVVVTDKPGSDAGTG